MHELTRHDDLNALRQKRFRVPELFRHGAWLAVPVGQRSEPNLGPSGMQILLWLPVAASDSPDVPTWTAVAEVIGAPRGPASRTAPAEAMDALLPENVGLDRVVDGNRWLIRGTEYPAESFGSIFWKHGWALGTGAGLLVSLMSG